MGRQEIIKFVEHCMEIFKKIIYTMSRMQNIRKEVLIFVGLLLVIFLFSVIYLRYLQPREWEDITPSTNDSNNASACTGIYSPVCGIDNKTYPNNCLAKAAAVSIAYSGECKKSEPVCTDSESGKNLFTAGNVSYGSIIKSDLCINSTTILEYSCTNKTITSDYADCPVGYQCVNGACSIGVLNASSCYDSDNGK